MLAMGIQRPVVHAADWDHHKMERIAGQNIADRTYRFLVESDQGLE